MLLVVISGLAYITRSKITTGSQIYKRTKKYYKAVDTMIDLW